jgi:hypothetical protein
MSEKLDLKGIERKAFRSVHQDGLWDIYIGGIVLCMSFLAYTVSNEAKPLLRFGLYLAGMGVFYLIFWAGKKYLTTPRLGQVKFGPRRQKRKQIMLGVLAGIVGLLVVILVGTILLWKNPNLAARLGFSQANPDLERLLVATIGALFVGPSMVLLAYFNEFMRGYYIAVILSLAVFSLTWFGKPVYLVLSGLLIIIPGLILFVRFLRSHPLPPVEVTYD